MTARPLAPLPRLVPAARRERGQVLLIVIVMMLTVTISAASFIWFMNQQQARVGTRYRRLAALHVAEAGLHRALTILESASAPDGTRGRDWRPAEFTEPVPVGPFDGRFVLSVQSEAGGALLVTSDGEVGGGARRVRARVHLAPPALLVGVYGTSAIRVEDGGILVVTSYGRAPAYPWVHLAAGREIAFVGGEPRLNMPPLPPGLVPGPLDPLPAFAGTGRLEAARVLLGREGLIRVGDRAGLDASQLQIGGAGVEEVIRRDALLPPLPEVDAEFYQALAQGNTANADLNAAAGGGRGNRGLAGKTDSRYEADEFQALLAYLRDHPDAAPLRGIVYVEGRVTLAARARLRIVDGTLVAENTVKLEEEAELEVTHGPATRSLPALLILGSGGLVLEREARLRAHGLVYATAVVDVGEQAVVDVVGALAANDPGNSVRLKAALLVVRYDPAVLGTPGLEVEADDPVVAWVGAWVESGP